MMGRTVVSAMKYAEIRFKQAVAHLYQAFVGTEGLQTLWKAELGDYITNSETREFQR